ncbi:transposase [Bradyrhizobium sp. LM3.6]
MRHVREVIRLKSAGMPTREIARRVGTAPSTVRLTIRRFEAAGLTWPLPDDVTDTVLEARLFASAGAGPGTRRGHRRQAEPDWAAVHRELKRKHVTLSIVWEEYIAGEPGGYRYSRFCELCGACLVDVAFIKSHDRDRGASSGASCIFVHACDRAQPVSRR